MNLYSHLCKRPQDTSLVTMEKWVSSKELDQKVLNDRLACCCLTTHSLRIQYMQYSCHGDENIHIERCLNI